MDLSIIIVSWNVREILRENLRLTLSATAGLSSEVIVIDNASIDGSAAMVASEFPTVKLIANAENLGFAQANNQGLTLATGRYLLLFNPDMQPNPSTFTDLIQWCDQNPGAGVVGVRLVGEHGELVKHVRRLPTLFDQLAIVLKLPHLWQGLLNHYLRVDFNYTHASVVDSVRGSFFTIRREVYERLGGLDARYFVWFEEVDYCRQVATNGWSVMYTPTVTCTDLVGKSFSQLPRGRSQQFFQDSMLKYFAKWHPAWQAVVLRYAWSLGSRIARTGEWLGINTRAKT